MCQYGDTDDDNDAGAIAVAFMLLCYAHSHIELWSFSFRIIRINEHKSFGVWNYFINRSFQPIPCYWFIVDSNTRLTQKETERMWYVRELYKKKQQPKKKISKVKANWEHTQRIESITNDCCSWLLQTINPYSTIQNHNTLLCYALLTQPIIIIAFSLFSLWLPV